MKYRIHLNGRRLKGGELLGEYVLHPDGLHIRFSARLYAADTVVRKECYPCGSVISRPFRLLQEISPGCWSHFKEEGRLLVPGLTLSASPALRYEDAYYRLGLWEKGL